jgi:hypothetical protein
VRYEARAYGTRAEIEAEIRGGLGGHRSKRRQAEGEAALLELADGADRVTFGKILYVVEE